MRNLLTYEHDKPTDLNSLPVLKPYIATLSNGIFRYLNYGVATVCEQIGYLKEGNSLFGLEQGEEFIQYNFPKIPFKFWQMTLDLFKDVYDTIRTESSTIILYIKDMEDFNNYLNTKNEEVKSRFFIEGNYVLYVPKQLATNITIQFSDDLEFNELSDYDMNKIIKVVELHSHHVMNAFWSDTDIRNQNENIIYGVYGRIKNDVQFTMKFHFNGKDIDMDVREVFEFPTVTQSVRNENLNEVYEFYPTEVIDSDFNALKESIDSMPVQNYVGNFNTSEHYNKKWLDAVRSLSTLGSKFTKKDTFNFDNDNYYNDILEDIDSLVEYDNVFDDIREEDIEPMNKIKMTDYFKNQ